jgi:hypothetical protein
MCQELVKNSSRNGLLFKVTKREERRIIPLPGLAELPYSGLASD